MTIVHKEYTIFDSPLPELTAEIWLTLGAVPILPQKNAVAGRSGHSCQYVPGPLLPFPDFIFN